MTFQWWLIGSLLLSCGVMLFAERSGLPVMLRLTLKGDIKRENLWFAQYGQAACSWAVGLGVLAMDARGWRAALPLMIAPLVTGLSGLIVKRLFGRIRPGHPGAGRFTWWCLRHAAWRESFPSNHAAAAAALTVGLAYLYPQMGWLVWWLAGYCALLRYLMDAHWPSDVLAGLAYGCIVGSIVWIVMLSAGVAV